MDSNLEKHKFLLYIFEETLCVGFYSRYQVLIEHMKQSMNVTSVTISLKINYMPDFKKVTLFYTKPEVLCPLRSATHQTRLKCKQLEAKIVHTNMAIESHCL